MLLASSLGLFLAIVPGCRGTDGLSPSVEPPTATVPPSDDTTVPADSIAPTDSLTGGSGDSVGISTLTLAPGSAPGIAYGTFNLDLSLLGQVHTGSLILPTPYTIQTSLPLARSRKARLVLRLSGSEARIKNADGTFSLTKWKTQIDRFRTVNLNSYITDGTILGHYLIDEPYRAARWGGKTISQATVEAMAKYSKQIWPGMPTLVRAAPSWLAGATVTYTYLDAGWTQYASYQGDVVKWITAEAAKAKTKGLGLMVGVNALNGGNGSSRIRGTEAGKYSMSASELRTYGTALLNQTLACGFFNWSYLYSGPTYFNRSDIKSAMLDLSRKAKAHIRTSCRQ